MNIKNGQSVKIISGKYEGGAGTVQEAREETGKAKIYISGIVNGEEVNTEVWLNLTQLEPL